MALSLAYSLAMDASIENRAPVEAVHLAVVESRVSWHNRTKRHRRERRSWSFGFGPNRP
ncbi:MAG: hypothetical protein ACRD4R_11510 [Candidatus Acidiferrales bacterium]